MKTSVNQRLENFIDSKKISNVEFGELIGESKYTINNWFKKGVKIPIPTLTNILNAFPDLDARWLLTGTGEMSQKIKPYKENDSVLLVKDAEVVKVDVSEFDKLIAAKDETILSQKVTIKILSDMLGAELPPGEHPPSAKQRKPKIKGFGAISSEDFNSVIQTYLKQINDPKPG